MAATIRTLTRDRPLAADADDLAVLHDAQEPHLRGERELADFVEKQRAAVRLLEPALAARHRAGERSLLVAEELGIDQLRGDRAAVHAPERTAAEGRVLVDGAGDDLLARAGLAEEEHRRAAARDHAGAGHHRGEAGIAADQPFLALAGVAIDQTDRRAGAGRCGPNTL